MMLNKVLKVDNQFTYDYVKLYIGYFSNRISVWEGILTLDFHHFLKTITLGTWVSDSMKIED